MKRPSLLAVRIGLIGLAVVASAYSVRRALAFRHLGAARDAARSGEPARADAAIVDVLRLAGRDPQLLVPAARGAASGAWGTTVDGMQGMVFGWALETNPLHGGLWHRAATWRLGAGDGFGARFAIERAVRLDPTNPRVHLVSALLAFRDGDYDAFRAKAVEAIGYGLTTGYEDLPFRPGERSGAVVEGLRQRLGRFPAGSTDTIVAMADAQAADRRFDEALETLRGAPAPGGRRNWQVELKEFQVLEQAGRRPEAIDGLEKGLAAGRWPEREKKVFAWALVAALSQEAGTEPKVLHAAASEAARLWPGRAEPFFWTARFHRGRKEPALTVEWSRLGATTEPSRVESWAQFADNSLAVGSWTGAQEAFRRLLPLEDGVEGAVRYAQEALERDDLLAAKEALTAASARRADDPRVRMLEERFGKRLLEQGRGGLPR